MYLTPLLPPHLPLPFMPRHPRHVDLSGRGRVGGSPHAGNSLGAKIVRKRCKGRAWGPACKNMALHAGMRFYIQELGLHMQEIGCVQKSLATKQGLPWGPARKNLVLPAGILVQMQELDPHMHEITWVRKLPAKAQGAALGSWMQKCAYTCMNLVLYAGI